MAQEQDHEYAVVAEEIEIAEETMLADLRDYLIDYFKHGSNIKPWKEMTQEEQLGLADRLEMFVRPAIAKAVNIIASKGFHTVSAQLEKVTIKDQYQCVLNVSKHTEERHAIADATGSAVKIIVADAEDFMGGEDAETDPDQPDLPVADSAENIPQDSVLDDEGPDPLDQEYAA